MPASPQIVPYSGDQDLGDMVLSEIAIEQPGTRLSVGMIFECPSTTLKGASFINRTQYVVHDTPPPPLPYWIKLRPIRYSVVTGPNVCTLVHPEGKPSDELQQHWAESIPGFRPPTFAEIDRDDSLAQVSNFDKVVAYLPIEGIKKEVPVHDPDVHYRVASKAEISFMEGVSAPKLYKDTKSIRPCVVKLTHGLGSVGIFIIKNDRDEAEWLKWYNCNGKPDHVVTEFIDIARNLAAHFFIHQNGTITWFGYSENVKTEDGRWSSSTTFNLSSQQYMMDLLSPHVKAVAKHCHSLGFFGPMGIDVVIDEEGRGVVLDVNPRVTGTMPACMVYSKMVHLGFTQCLFSKSTDSYFLGSEKQLLKLVSIINQDSKVRVVVFSCHEVSRDKCLVNYAIYSNNGADISHFHSTSIKDLGPAHAHKWWSFKGGVC